MTIVIAALFFALGGGTVAASQHYLITSKKQIKPSVLKQLKGAKGPRGVRGAQGAAGVQGAVGATGPAGITGTGGATGVQGATGPAGITGARGATGVQGATGTAGINGAIGPQGATGPSGSTGATGQQGSSGVVTTVTFNGLVSTIAGSNTSYVFAGPFSLVTTTSSQRFTGAASAPLGSSTASAGGQSFEYSLCYQSSGGGTISNFGSYSIGKVYPTQQTFATAASVVLGEGTWKVGFCVRNAYGSNSIDLNDRANGWVQVTN
jgi:hypothetical protein